MAFQDVANGSKVSVMSFGTPPIFSDVGNTYWANEFIERLYNAGITGGCGVNPLKYCPVLPGRYCPEGIVNRAQMAIFLVKTFNLP